jgi:hypothetical protein
VIEQRLRISWIGTLASISLLSACAAVAYQYDAVAYTEAFFPNRSVTAPAAIRYVLPEADLDFGIAPLTPPCGGYKYEVKVSAALRDTLQSVDHAAFLNRVAPGTPNANSVLVELLSYEPSLSYTEPNVFPSSATARADLKLRVVVWDREGGVLMRNTVSGSGSLSSDSPACSDGAYILAQTVQRAIRQVAQEYASRIMEVFDRR